MAQSPQSQSLAPPVEKYNVRFALEKRAAAASLSTPYTPPSEHSVPSLSTGSSPESTRSDLASFTFGQSTCSPSSSPSVSPVKSKDVHHQQHAAKVIKDAINAFPPQRKQPLNTSGLHARPGMRRSITEMTVASARSLAASSSATRQTSGRQPHYTVDPPSFSGSDIAFANAPFSALLANAGQMPARVPHVPRVETPQDRMAQPIQSVNASSSHIPGDSRYVQTLHASMQASATRWLQIAGLPKTLNSAYLLEHIFGEYGSLQGMWARRLTTEGIIIVGYNDSRDALRAFKALRHKRFFNERLLTAHFVPRHLIQALAPQGTDVLLSCNVGEVSIAVKGYGECPKDVLYSLFCSYGDIKAFRFCDEDHGSYMLCDYFDLSDAALAVQELDNKRVRDCTLMVRFVAPDDAQDPPTAAHAAFDRRTAWDAFGHLSPVVMDPMGRPGQSAIPVWFTPDLHPSWSAMTALERSNSWQTFEQEQKHRAARFIDSNRRASVVKMPTSIAEQQQQPRSSPLAYAVSSHSTPTPMEPATGYFDLPRAAASSLTPVSTPLQAPSANDALKASLLSQLARFTPSTGMLGTPGDSDRNSVKPDRITQGQDVRTTIMIKNIPNKFTQSMLKDWLDETSPGCYDFLYLRIDFQNKCNVGYAFVNFIDAREILAFYEERVGTCWHVFSSEKRCDISYANIQGREKLVEKFRNSSVMDQDPAFRPKLFHTAGTSKGYEEPFPACNDPKKKARSTLDAQTTGLFPPVGSLSSSRVGTPLRPPSVRGDRGTGAASPVTGLLTPPLSTRLGQRLERKETPAQSPLAKMVVRPSSKRA